MRVEAGRYACKNRKGEVIHVDQQLSMEQADLLCAIIERAGQTVKTTFAVEITEARQTVEWWHDASATRHVTELSGNTLTHLDSSDG